MDADETRRGHTGVVILFCEAMSHPTSAIHEVSGEARAALERLLESEVITRAPRVKAVLQYLVNSLIAGHVHGLNEQMIGEVVFHRPSGYNPAEDNIVRVTISNARSRLQQYYSNEGRDERWLLDIPRGRYIPLVCQRPAAVAPEPMHIAARDLAPLGMRHVGRPRRIATWIGFALICALSILSVFIYVRSKADARRSAVLRATAVASRASSADVGLIQELFFHRSQRVSLVLVDQNLEAYREIFQRTVSLDAYLAYDYGRSQKNDSASERRARYFSKLTDSTSVSSAAIAARFERVAYPDLLPIRHPHDMSLRNMERENVILLGGPWINPWGQLFEERLNFRIIADSENAAQSHFENVNPAPGEPKLFSPHRVGALGVSYARIALVPNLAGSGKILMLGANNHYSMEAAADFVMTASGLQHILSSLGAKSVDEIAQFEILLQVTGIQSTADGAQVIACRPPAHRPT